MDSVERIKKGWRKVELASSDGGVLALFGGVRFWAKALWSFGRRGTWGSFALKVTSVTRGISWHAQQMDQITGRENRNQVPMLCVGMQEIQDKTVRKIER